MEYIDARQQPAVLFYQQSIQGAFRSVSDAVVAYHKTREFRLWKPPVPLSEV
jgi:hypothetical protein